jgi:hypothetical protein
LIVTVPPSAPTGLDAGTGGTVDVSRGVVGEPDSHPSTTINAATCAETAAPRQKLALDMTVLPITLLRVCMVLPVYALYGGRVF